MARTNAAIRREVWGNLNSRVWAIRKLRESSLEDRGTLEMAAAIGKMWSRKGLAELKKRGQILGPRRI